MKKYLATIQVYDTDGLLPDLFGETQKIVLEARDLPHARGQIEKQMSDLFFSFASLKSLEEIAFE